MNGMRKRAGKTLRKAGRKIAQKKAVGSCVPHDRKDEFVIVGNYKEGQLAWIKKNGVYNYPVREGDEFSDDALRAVKELWLFADVKSTRHAFAVKSYVGKMTKKEFVAKYPTYKKPTHDAYYVFEVTPLDYEPTVNTEIVIARTADFGRRTAKIRKAIEQFKADGEYGPLAAYLPKPLTQVPPKQLRVSECQLDFFGLLGVEFKREVPFPNPQHPTFSFIDLFAGIGGFRLAMRNCGGECVFSSEFDPYAQKTYEANFGEVPAGDITKQETQDLIPAKFDVVCAGFPCQAFSLAGKRMGFKDNFRGLSRGTLFQEVVKICEKHHPKAVFCENVKGLYIHDHGNTFQVIKGAFEEIGYKFFWKILNSKDFGVPQCRERIYMVAFRGDCAPATFEFPAPTGEKVCLSQIRQGSQPGDPPVTGRYYLSDVYVETLRRHRRRHEAAGHGFGYVIRKWDGVSGAIVCGGMGRETNLVQEEGNKTPSGIFPETHIKGKINEEGIRKMTPLEWSRLQGFPKGYQLTLSDVHLYKQFGNSVSVPVIQAIAERIVKQLTLVDQQRKVG